VKLLKKGATMANGQNGQGRFIIKVVVVLALIAVAAYVAVRVYNYVISDATKRLTAGAAAGVSSGITQGIGGAVNPMKMFGGGK
jgi:hypothetical protein